MKRETGHNGQYHKADLTSAPIPRRVIAPAGYGLTEEQVLERKEAGLTNIPVEAPTKTVVQIILGNLLSYFNLIFFILAAALILVKSYQNIMFMGIVIVNTVIGILQELHAKHTLDKLVLLSEPKITAIRDGKHCRVPIDELVLDDVVLFKSGNQICADAVILDGSVQINESLITGESDEIMKKPGDSLLSGSYAVSGECSARLERVGYDSFVSKLTLEAKRAKKHKQPKMMRALTLLLKIIGVIIIPVGLLLYHQQTEILGLTMKEGVENTTAALIGMIPEGLYLLVNVALAVSVVRLAKKKTLVHDLKSTETLARVDVLCVDKTGTITENTMQVTDVISLRSTMSLLYVEKLLADFTGNMPADNATMQALKKRFPKTSGRKAARVQTFSSVMKYSAVAFGGGEAYVLGAPEFILNNQYQLYRKSIENYTTRGSRVLMLAECRDFHENSSPEMASPIALVLLDNPVRPTAHSTFEYFVKQGVEIKVISGDNPMTVVAAAKQAGILNADCYIDAATLDSEYKVEDAATKYTVFGRVTPKQKRLLVQALQKEGHTVAMTGDGVNDVLALKAADCSIAMAAGSDVACQVSNLVLLDSDFSSMPSVVAEGRRVINNIERSAALFLVKNIFSFALSLISIIAVFAYPLTPSQLSLIGALTIGIPSFLLALEPNTERVKGRFLRNVLFRALPAAMTDLFIIIGVILFTFAFPMDSSETSTVTTILVSAVGFVMIWRVSRPFNWHRVVLLVALILAFLAVLIIIPEMFSVSHIGFGSILILSVFLLIIPSAMWAFTLGMDKLASFYHFARKKIRHILKRD